MEQRLIVGISGATGVILAKKSIAAFVEAGFCIDLVISSAALYTAAHELGKEFCTAKRFVDHFPESISEKIRLHGINDVGSAISSGSYQVAGMVIIPCSMATVAAVAHGLGDNCLRRAADVTIKERRRLVIVPRETPFSTIHLENMLKLSQLGAMIVPPIPAWYTKPESLADVEDFVVGKVLDCFHIDHSKYPRWKSIQVKSIEAESAVDQ